ncbi:DUF6792 domain-containing protein [Alkalicoccobacillus porphyridii]|uniref:DUF6792 domain-containing protein n=1 Tax=Alkalicoccobacillus porphyridii TaxID=2597270 RepID=A0A553ZW83_9BACI|nr:DUF6792 domain-containing protein [Alkalicoccobacillus porphyridii]TSB45729.1 hypothetical protein FN960_14675 [Alkalicoccobacillus porphyridii]
MKNKELLEEKEVWLRITQLEYQMKNGMTNKEFQTEVERIYLEEMGENIPADMTIFNSNESDSIDSSYDGTAIHFLNEEKGIDQLYIISQGSNDSGDWSYNGYGLFLGRDASQAHDTNAFLYEAQEKLDVDVENSLAISLGHSLANNNNLTAQVFRNDFDKIYGVNGAQISIYQLYDEDSLFTQKVNQEFSISRLDELGVYSIPKDELEKFALEYIKEQIDTGAIYQLRSSNDPLYAIMQNIRGFVTVGEDNVIVTNSDVSGLTELFSDIPDEEIAKWQEILIPPADAYVENGIDGASDVFEEMTGVNKNIISDINALAKDFEELVTFEELNSSGRTITAQMTNMSNDLIMQIMGKVPDAISNTGDAIEILNQIKDIQRNLGPAMDTIDGLNNSSEEIFSYLVEGNYINEESKKTVVEELNGLTESLQKIVDYEFTEDFYKDNPHSLSAGSAFSILMDNVAFVIMLLGEKDKLLGHIDALSEELGEVSSDIAHSHSIEEMLNAIAPDGVSYRGNDMYLSTGKGANEIKLNLTQVVETYHQGMKSIELQIESAHKFMEYYEQGVIDDTSERKQELIGKYNEMESNPRGHQALLSSTSAPQLSLIERINVNEVIPGPIIPEHITWTNMIQEQLEQQRVMLETIRDGVEEIFGADHEVANIFQLSGGQG